MCGTGPRWSSRHFTEPGGCTMRAEVPHPTLQGVRGRGGVSPPPQGLQHVSNAGSMTSAPGSIGGGSSSGAGSFGGNLGPARIASSPSRDGMSGANFSKASPRSANSMGSLKLSSPPSQEHVRANISPTQRGALIQTMSSGATVGQGGMAMPFVVTSEHRHPSIDSARSANSEHGSARARSSSREGQGLVQYGFVPGQFSRPNTPDPSRPWRSPGPDGNRGYEFAPLRQESPGPPQGYTYAHAEKKMPTLPTVQSASMERETSSLPVAPPEAKPRKSFDPNMVSLARISMLLALWAISVVTWIVGAYFIPTLEIHIMPGTSMHSEVTRSIYKTLWDLYDNDTYFACSVLAFYSVVVPIFKLTATIYLVIKLCYTPSASVYSAHSNMIWSLSYLASYQLTDVYVGILFITYFNSDSADANFLSGFYWFFNYCIVSMIMSVILEGAFPQMAQDGRTDPDDVDDFDPPTPGARRVQATLDEEVSSSRNGLLDGDSNNAVSIRGVWPVVKVDARCAWFFSLMFLVLMALSAPNPIIELRTLWSGVAVDRSSHSMLEVFRDSVPNLLSAGVCIVLWLMNVVFPLVYVSALLAITVFPRGLLVTRWGPNTCDLSGVFGMLAELVRPWATTDVYVFATLVFLFTVQDPQTLTTPVEGWDFYYFLGGGLSFFFLRWFTEAVEGGETCVEKTLALLTQVFPSLPRPECCNPVISLIGRTSRLFTLVCIWGVACMIVLPGVPGSSTYKSFPALDTVCKNAAPMVNSTIRTMLPASYGDCQNALSQPPQPCEGDKPLYEQYSDGDHFIKALWLAGINSLRLSGCNLWHDDAEMIEDQPWTKYHLEIDGQFDYVQLFLDMRQCTSVIGCTAFATADNCCGKNIGVRLRFDMECSPTTGDDSFHSFTLASIELGQLIVNAQGGDGNHLSMVLDISPQVEDVVRGEIRRIISDTHLKWAGQSMDIPMLLNKLIKYNSPGSAGSC